jgi:hypothetical protein
MKDKLAFIDAAIELENTLSGLYAYFSNRFIDDFTFWDQLRIEELNHAALLGTIRNLSKVNLFPEGLVLEDLDAYERNIRLINSSMNEHIIPNRKAAFEFAYQIENSAGELHYQNMTTIQDPDEITRIFITLNGKDRDHAERIMSYQQAGSKRK